MQTNLNEEKKKIKSEVKKFLEEEKIEFYEDNEHIKIKGELTYIVFVKFVELSIKTGTDKYLKITYDFEKLTLTYEETFPKEIKKKLEIQKNEVQAIYYTNNKLVILF